MAAHGDNFVVTWSICRRLVEQDRHVLEEFVQMEHSRQWAVPRKRAAEPAVQVVQPRATTQQGKRMVTDSITGLEGVRVLSAGDKRAPQLNPVDPRREELWQI